MFTKNFQISHEKFLPKRLVFDDKPPEAAPGATREAVIGLMERFRNPTLLADQNPNARLAIADALITQLDTAPVPDPMKDTFRYSIRKTLDEIKVAQPTLGTQIDALKGRLASVELAPITAQIDEISRLQGQTLEKVSRLDALITQLNDNTNIDEARKSQLRTSIDRVLSGITTQDANERYEVNRLRLRMASRAQGIGERISYIAGSVAIFKPALDKLMGGDFTAFEDVLRYGKLLFAALTGGKIEAGVATAPANPNPAPGQNPTNAESQAPNQARAPERLGENVTNLRQLDLVSNPSNLREGYISFSVKINNKPTNFRVNTYGEAAGVDATTPLPAGVTESQLFLPTFLREHRVKMASLSTNLGIANDLAKKAELTDTLIGLQKLENNKDQPQDLINLLSDKISQFKAADSSRTNELIIAGLKNVDHTPNAMLEAIRNFNPPASPPQGQGGPTALPQGKAPIEKSIKAAPKKN